MAAQALAPVYPKQVKCHRAKDQLKAPQIHISFWRRLFVGFAGMVGWVSALLVPASN